LSDLPAEKKTAQFDALSREFGMAPFDLEKGPLIRFRLVRIEENDHRLLASFHHMVTDGTSWPLFVDELTACYAGQALAPLPVQYGQYAAWQKEMLQGETWRDHELYWREMLGGPLPVVDLPADHPRPQVRALRGAVYEQTLSLELTAALKGVREKHNSTLFKLLLAAFNVLLHRLTGETDLIVSTTLTGRMPPEMARGIGFFVNTAALRTSIDGDPSFVAVLNQVQSRLDEAVRHEGYPYNEVLRCVSPLRSMNREPITAVSFTKLPPPVERRIGTLVVSEDRLFLDTENLDLSVYTQDTMHGIRLICVYNADLFEPDTIKQILGQYRTLLENIVSNPQRPISAYELLSDAERRHLASRTNSVRSNQPFIVFQQEEIEQSIASRFESQVDRYSDKTAIKTKTHQWSYGKLNHKANQIAATIVKLSSGREQRVGLLFEHDGPMIAAILGTLKSGATYIPLETFHPADRISYMLQDSQATAIVTDSGSMPLARSLSSGKLPLINVDEIDGSNTLAPASPISPDTLAYILYTSGSTGTPKGVMQNHRNVLRHIRNYTNSLHINADDRLTLFSSCGFDAAIMDIFGALLNGATLYPMGLREEGISSAVVDRLISQKITVYHSTPSVFRHLFHTSPGGTDLSSVRIVVFGGEQTLKGDVDLFNRCFSEHTILVNGLGPTECTLALQYFIRHDDRAVNELVPVGYPVENTEVLLLDQAGEPTDVYGEIGIKGPGLALGYWGREELTDIAFVPDPTGGTGRTYRTGDMGRLLPDGSIGFVGRKDAQVKIRGFRVEPGEVEFVLGKHPAVQETAVVTREDASGTSALVAYVVPKQGVVFFATEARSFLKKQLPDYMVPSAFVLLEIFPLTANGKVDRRALPAPDSTRPELEQPFVAPRNQVEEVLANIWAEILALDKVGVCDNFFDLGGHSLLATRLVSRIQRELNLPVSLRDIFENPTIESLARRLLRQSGASTAGEIDELLSELESISDESAERQLSKT
jgi:amino acid adenylation domain-containing protein